MIEAVLPSQTKNYVGKASDGFPTNPNIGSKLYQHDTSSVYIYTGTTDGWVEYMPNLRHLVEALNEGGM